MDRGEFDKPMFRIAMYLISKIKKGNPLPKYISN